MKKLLAIVVLGLLLCTNANSKITNFKKGTFHEGDVYWKHKKISLPPGKCEAVEKWGWSAGFWTVDGVSLVQYTDNQVHAFFDVGDMDFKGRYQGYIAPWIEEILYHDEHDGCYERPEYTLMKRFKKGKVHNCMTVAHMDVEKELHRPDDADSKWTSAILRKWLRENNIKVPRIMLSAWGIYYAPVVRDTYYFWAYSIDPEFFGASKNKFFTEETSEYYPSNINNFPDKKKFMNDWIITAAKFHKSMELILKAKEHHKLDFSEYNIEESSYTTTTTTTSGSKLTKQIKELKQLYDDGVLTQEEFTKAKKKLLN